MLKPRVVGIPGPMGPEGPVGPEGPIGPEGPEGPIGPSFYEGSLIVKIRDILCPIDTASITFDDIDLDADKGYLLVANIKGIAENYDSIRIYFNYDLELSNYGCLLAWLQWSATPAWLLQGFNDAIFAVLRFTDRREGYFQSFISRLPDGHPGWNTQGQGGIRLAGYDHYVDGFLGWGKRKVAENVTQIIIASTVLGFGAGSRFMLYKFNT